MEPSIFSLSKSSEILKVAIQSSGRLSEDSLNLVQKCGIKLNRASRKLKASAENFPLEILYLRDDDIPEYVADGVADIGIVGENLVVEQEKDVAVVEKLGFARCRLSLAIAKDFEYRTIQDLAGKNIATSYPNTLRQFLIQQNVTANIREIRGSTEIAPSIGLAEAICDLVSTGSTLFSNGLKEVEILLHSEALLVKNKALTSKKTLLLEKILFRIQAVKKAIGSKYLLLNAPNDVLPKISALLPGLTSPTILPLAREGWSSVHSVVNDSGFWELAEQLKEIGAEGILVLPIENIIS